jgi:hypothetical protein
MQMIIAPIKFEESSSSVTNLQSTLLIMLPAIGFTEFVIPKHELDAQQALGGTIEAIKILRDQFPDNYNETLLVDVLMAKRINDFMRNYYVVKGTITNIHQKGLANYLVHINEYDLDKIKSIGKVFTDQDGEFELTFLYTQDMQFNDNTTNPDIYFDIVTPSGEELSIAQIFIINNGRETKVESLANSPRAPIVLTNVTNEMNVHIIPNIIEIILTKFEILIMTLSPFLDNNNFIELKEDEENFQISFLSKDSGIEKSAIQKLQLAFLNERNSKLPSWAFFGLSNIPLPFSEWNNKTSEEFIALLQSFKPTNAIEDLNRLAANLRVMEKIIE